MAISFGFYDSVDGDRKYNATHFGNFFDGIIGDGVFEGVGSEFFIRVLSGNRVTVGPGRAWFNKTWTYNDGDYEVTMPPPPTGNNRWDAIVLTIDRRNESRENRIEVISGDQSSSPKLPTLNSPTLVNQYILGYVRRKKNNAVITQGDTVTLVGRSGCPYATNVLGSEDIWDPLQHKRDIVRGNYLGSVLSNEQKLAIRTGSFEGLFLGDYWTYDGVNYRIVDFNYWKGKQARTSPAARVTANHVVIVPDNPDDYLPPHPPYGRDPIIKFPIDLNAPPPTYGRKNSDCGWEFALESHQLLFRFERYITSLFGEQGLLSRMIRRTTTYSPSRMAMNATPRDVFLSPMTEQMLIGNRNMGLPHSENDVTQLALYTHGPRYIWMGQEQGLLSQYTAFWLANQYTKDHWTCHHDWGGAYAHNPSDPAHYSSHIIRPVFGITGL